MARKDLLICTILYGETAEKTLKLMHKAKSDGADVVELRVNSLSIVDVTQILKEKVLPIIVSCSCRDVISTTDSIQGEDKRKCFDVLRLALDLEAEYVDVELEVASEFMAIAGSSKSSDSKIIVSSHVTGATPSSEALGNIVAEMQSSGADIIKLATNVADITDVARIFHLLSHAQECDVPLIAVAMGDRGLISQLLAPKFGGFLVYGSMEGDPVPGLPTLASLTEVYKLKNVNSDTKIFGLVSNPIGHSKGPMLHNPTFMHAGYDGIYVPFLVDDVNKFFKTYSSPDFAGFSVGIPHKEAAIACCDEVHPLAKAIGAVNTVIRRVGDGKLIGYNTDCEAAITAIEDALIREKRTRANDQAKSNASPLAGTLFVLVGAGGAGRALAFGAKSRGARIVVFDGHYEKAKALAHAVYGEARPFDELRSFTTPEGEMILAHATYIGMEPNTHHTPVPKEVLGSYKLVFDAVYTPKKTRLLMEAEEAGAIVVSGVEMFIRQALSQFKFFAGDTPEDFMREVVLKKF